MSRPASKISGQPSPRRRLTREDRQRQLLDVAWRLIREEGTDALTLGHLAERAGVTKPVVYDHFVTRQGLLAALYDEFDARHTALMDAALANSEPTLASRAAVIAASYVDCVLAGGREIPGVMAALAGSPELEKIKHDCAVAFMAKCRTVLAPFAPARTITPAGLWAMLGAAEGLSQAAAMQDIAAAEARDELVAIIVAMVGRNAGQATQGARRGGRSRRDVS